MFKENFEVIPKLNEGHDNNTRCSDSHKKVCQDAFSKNYKKIVIFEDDAEKRNIDIEIEKKISNWIKHNDWDIVFLGSISTNLLLPVNNHIRKTLGSLLAHAYCLNEKMIDKVANFYNPSDKTFSILDTVNKPGEEHGSIDNFYRKECLTNNAYITSPELFYQNREPEDITKIKEVYFSKNKY